MNVKNLPVVSLPKVWHIGTMKQAEKAMQWKSSYEGAGLSVSVNPDAWESIAELGGSPWWQLARADKAPGRFLNLYATKGNSRKALVEMATSKGWLVRGERFKVSYPDPETETRRICSFATEAQARTERDFLREEAEGNVRMWRVETELATPALEAIIGQTIAGEEGYELAVTALVEEFDTLDGVWWRAPLDVAALSAPVGVISLRALPLWVSRKVRRFDTMC